MSQPPSAASKASPTHGLRWSWADASRAAVCAVPAGVIIGLGDLDRGMAWAIGALPGAIVSLAPTRRQRRATVLIGLLGGASLLLGSLLSELPVAAVIGIFALALIASVAGASRPRGLIVLTMCLPLVAVGLSYSGVADAAYLALLIAAGSLVAFLVSLAWPESDPGPVASPPGPTPMADALRYGIRVGLAASIATGIGFAIGTDHVGWAPAAALFVIRPRAQMQELRSVGRVVSVVVGALGAVVLLRLGPSAGVLAIVTIVSVAAAAGTHTSRWYVTPTFSTFLVMLLLLASDPSAAAVQWRFWERVGLTVVGVALAYVFGLLLPTLSRRRHSPGSAPPTAGS